MFHCDLKNTCKIENINVIYKRFFVKILNFLDLMYKITLMTLLLKFINYLLIDKNVDFFIHVINYKNFKFARV